SYLLPPQVGEKFDSTAPLSATKQRRSWISRISASATNSILLNVDRSERAIESIRAVRHDHARLPFWPERIRAERNPVHQITRRLQYMRRVRGSEQRDLRAVAPLRLRGQIKIIVHDRALRLIQENDTARVLGIRIVWPYIVVPESQTRRQKERLIVF